MFSISFEKRADSNLIFLSLSSMRSSKSKYGLIRDMNYSGVTSPTYSVGGCINSLIWSEGKVSFEFVTKFDLIWPTLLLDKLPWFKLLRPPEIRLGIFCTSALKHGRLSMSLRLCVSMLVLSWLCTSMSELGMSILASTLDSGLIVSKFCDSDLD